MSKTMINTNRAVLVYFAGNTNEDQVTSSGAADIYVPFKVSQINVKGIDLDFDSDFRMMYFTSGLVNSGPLGSGYGGILYDNSSSTKELTYLFQDPRDINGVIHLPIIYLIQLLYIFRMVLLVELLHCQQTAHHQGEFFLC